MSRPRKTISLVLGSGGARGLAHIGIIDALTRRGYDIRSIAGSSMGALIGGIYAAGKLDVYARWVTALQRRDVIRLLDFAFDRAGLFKGERIINVLKDLIGDSNIEDLPIAFTAVATDLNTEKEIWFNRGPLFDAIRASIAIPTIFTPYTYEGMQLVDGGLVNPIPIAPTLSDQTDLIIAVALNGRPDPRLDQPHPAPQRSPDNAGGYHQRIVQFIEQSLQHAERPEEPGFFDVIARSMDTMQNAISRLKLAAYSPDLTIEVPRNACTFYDFHRAAELIEIGRVCAERKIDDIER